MKVLHLPSACGGNAWRLAQGERALGLDSRVLVSHGNRFAYSADIMLGVDPKSFAPYRLVRLCAAFARLRGGHDVFHFNFGSSLINLWRLGLPHLELPYYPKSARLFATYNGCDARQRGPTAARGGISACVEAGCYAGVCNAASDAAKAKAIARMVRHVRHIWALNPDLMYFLPEEKASFLPYAIPVADYGAPPCDYGAKPLVVLHAPTDKACKGTRHVLAALEEVNRLRPGEVVLELVEGLTHKQLMARMARAHVVIDQVLVGWYGGLAVEAMSMGKAVVSRIEEEDLRFIPGEMAADLREAVVWAGPDTLAEVLLACLDNRSRLAQAAAAGRAYVQRWHDAAVVARVTKEAYES